MSFVNFAPDMMATAAQDLAGIRSALGDAAAAATGPTTSMAAAAQDEVSTAIAKLFSAFGQEYQVLSAQAQAFHQEFVNVLNAGTESYVGAEAAAQQMLQSAARAGGVLGPYESLVGNTVANLGNLTNVFVRDTVPTLLQSAVTGIQQVGNLPGAVLAGLTGDPFPLIGFSGHIAQDYASLAQALSAPAQTIVTAMSPTQMSLMLVAGAPALLGWDLLGAPVNAFTASLASGQAFVSAIQTGNPLAAVTALVDAPANMTNAFLNGSETVSFPPPELAQMVMPPGTSINIPFSGLLAPSQPLFLTGTAVNSMTGQLQTIDVTTPLGGGFLASLLDVPRLIASGFAG